MNDTTYEQVAQSIGLIGNRRQLYCDYMCARWAGEESQHCATGYAQEWAERFLGGWEYSASDGGGKALLDRLNSERI